LAFFEPIKKSGLFPLGVFSQKTLPWFLGISPPYTIPILEEIWPRSMGVFFEILVGAHSE
jgi:hypothetical protein